MSTTVCLWANSLKHPEGGGHFWVYLNWALGLKALGCRVIWAEGVTSRWSAGRRESVLASLRGNLEPFGLANDIALCFIDSDARPQQAVDGCLSLEAASSQADLLLNFAYGKVNDPVRWFRRSALVDIDPGLLQVWMSEQQIQVAPHDAYFTTGETVGAPEALFPNAGIRWQYAPPCVALDWWPARPPADKAPFTTVSNWHTSKEWVVHGNDSYQNDKRSGFLPYLELPRHTSQNLELALCQKALDEQWQLEDAEADWKRELELLGWTIVHSYSVASTPEAYQQYIQRSKGEFSCAKPSCIRLQNAWVSDRTLCYLASGRPAVVQHTGPSRVLPDAEGIFRFQNLEQAASYLDRVASDYPQQCRLARALVEEHFDAERVARSVLERAL